MFLQTYNTYGQSYLNTIQEHLKKKDQGFLNLETISTTPDIQESNQLIQDSDLTKKFPELATSESEFSQDPVSTESATTITPEAFSSAVDSKSLADLGNIKTPSPSGVGNPALKQLGIQPEVKLEKGMENSKNSIVSTFNDVGYVIPLSRITEIGSDTNDNPIYETKDGQSFIYKNNVLSRPSNERGVPDLIYGKDFKINKDGLTVWADEFDDKKEEKKELNFFEPYTLDSKISYDKSIDIAGNNSYGSVEAFNKAFTDNPNYIQSLKPDGSPEMDGDSKVFKIKTQEELDRANAGMRDVATQINYYNQDIRQEKQAALDRTKELAEFEAELREKQVAKYGEATLKKYGGILTPEEAEQEDDSLRINEMLADGEAADRNEAVAMLEKDKALERSNKIDASKRWVEFITRSAEKAQEGRKSSGFSLGFKEFTDKEKTAWEKAAEDPEFGQFMNGEGKRFFGDWDTGLETNSSDTYLRKTILDKFTAWKRGNDNDYRDIIATKDQDYKMKIQQALKDNDIEKVNRLREERKPIQRSIVNLSEKIKTSYDQEAAFNEDFDLIKKQTDKASKEYAGYQNGDFSDVASYTAKSITGSLVNVASDIIGGVWATAGLFSDTASNTASAFARKTANPFNILQNGIYDEYSTYEKDGKKYEVRMGKVFELKEGKFVYDENLSKNVDQFASSSKKLESGTDWNLANTSGMIAQQTVMMLAPELASSRLAAATANSSRLLRATSKIASFFGEESVIGKAALNYTNYSKGLYSSLIWGEQTFLRNAETGKQAGLDPKQAWAYGMLQSAGTMALIHISPDSKIFGAYKEFNTNAFRLISQNKWQEFKALAEQTGKTLFRANSHELAQESTEQMFMYAVNGIYNSVAIDDKNKKLSTGNWKEWKDMFQQTAIVTTFLSAFGIASNGRLRLTGKEDKLQQYIIASQIDGIDNYLDEAARGSWFSNQSNQVEEAKNKIREVREYVKQIPQNSNLEVSETAEVIKRLQQIDELKKTYDQTTSDGIKKSIDNDINKLNNDVESILNAAKERNSNAQTPQPTQEPETPKDQNTESSPESEQDAAETTSGSGINSTFDKNHFTNPDNAYRIVVGDDAFNDIVESGVVRTNSKNKDIQKGDGVIDVTNRPTLFPSFSKGQISEEYAAGNENHYIIESNDPSIQESTSRRHGKGTTFFPTGADGKHLESLDAQKVNVYKHIGDGNYELVLQNGIKPESGSNNPAVENNAMPNVTYSENTKILLDVDSGKPIDMSTVDLSEINYEIAQKGKGERYAIVSRDKNNNNLLGMSIFRDENGKFSLDVLHERDASNLRNKGLESGIMKVMVEDARKKGITIHSSDIELGSSEIRAWESLVKSGDAIRLKDTVNDQEEPIRVYQTTEKTLSNEEIEATKKKYPNRDEKLINYLRNEIKVPENVISALPEDLSLTFKFLLGEKSDPILARLFTTSKAVGGYRPPKMVANTDTGDISFYDPTGKVSMNILSLLGSNLAGKTEAYGERIVFHEMVHAATVITMADMNTYQQNEQYQKTGKYSPEQLKAYQNIKDITQDYKKKLNSFKKLLPFGTSNYGLTNEYEFVAEFMTNPKFKRWILDESNEIYKRPKENILKRIWESVKILLGVKKRNLNEAFERQINDDIDVILKAQVDNLNYGIENETEKQTTNNDEYIEPVTTKTNNEQQNTADPTTEASIQDDQEEQIISEENLKSLLSLQNETTQGDDSSDNGNVTDGTDSIQLSEGREDSIQGTPETTEPGRSEKTTEVNDQLPSNQFEKSGKIYTQNEDGDFFTTDSNGNQRKVSNKKTISSLQDLSKLKKEDSIVQSLSKMGYTYKRYADGSEEIVSPKGKTITEKTKRKVVRGGKSVIENTANANFRKAKARIFGEKTANEINIETRARIKEAIQNFIPTTAKQAVLQYFANGGKINKDYVSQKLVGNSANLESRGKTRSIEDYRWAWFTDQKNPPSGENIAEQISQGEFADMAFDEQDLRNEVDDLLLTYGNISEVHEDLLDLYNKINDPYFGLSNQDQYDMWRSSLSSQENALIDDIQAEEGMSEEEKLKYYTENFEKSLNSLSDAEQQAIYEQSDRGRKEGVQPEGKGIQPGKNPDDNAEKFQKEIDSFTPISVKTFNELVGRLKKVFSKAFKNINVTTDWNDFLEKATQYKGAKSLEDIQFSQNLSDINAKFNRELNNLINGTIRPNYIFQLGKPSPILKSAGFPDLNITLSANLLQRKSQQVEHPFNLSNVRNLSKAIQKPLAVFESSTMPGRRVVFTELSDGTKNFVVALELNSEKNGIHINEVRSVYPRNNTQVLRSIANNESLYLDKKNMLDWINIQQFNSADAIRLSNISTNIINNFQNAISDTDVNNIKFQIESDNVNEYRLGHGAPNRDNGDAALHDLTDIYGDDIYSSKAVQYFGTGNQKMSKDSIDIIQKVQNNPDAEVTVYRAVPKNVNKINNGDWITINKQYAIDHGINHLNGEYKILEEKVKASQIFTDGNSIHEQGLQYMHLPDGSVYGAKLPDGTIYINPEKLNANTAIHEFSHLWEQVMPTSWKKGLEIFKATQTGKNIFNKLKQEGNYNNLTDEELWSEALNTHIGNIGEERFLNPQNKMTQLLDWIKRTFARIGEATGINKLLGRQLTPEDNLKTFTDGVVGDLLGSKAINPEQQGASGKTNFALGDLNLSSVADNVKKHLKEYHGYLKLKRRIANGDTLSPNTLRTVEESRFNDKDYAIDLGSPSNLLQQIGIPAGEISVPIEYLNTKIINQEKHDIASMTSFRNLVEGIHDPIAVFDNYEAGKRTEGRYEFFTSLRNDKEENIALILDTNNGNTIKTGFTLKNLNRLRGHLFNGSDIKYLNKPKLMEILRNYDTSNADYRLEYDRNNDRIKIISDKANRAELKFVRETVDLINNFQNPKIEGRNIQYHINPGSLIPAKTVQEVVKEIQENNLESGIDVLKQSPWYTNLSDSKKKQFIDENLFTANNIVSTLIANEQRRQELIKERGQKKVEKTENAKNDEIKTIRKTFQEKITELRNLHRDLEKQLNTVNSNLQKLSERNYLRKQAVNTIKVMLSDRVIKKNITPYEIKTLITSAEKIMNARDFNKALDAFQQKSDSIITKALTRFGKKDDFQKFDIADGALTADEKAPYEPLSTSKRTKLKQFREKWFANQGGILQPFMYDKDRAIGNTELEIRRAKDIVKRLNTAAKKENYTDKEWNIFDQAMRGDLNAYNTLSEAIKPYVSAMRQQIDGLSNFLINNNLVTGDQAANINNNLGTYVTRGYSYFEGKSNIEKVSKKFFRFLFKDQGGFRPKFDADKWANAVTVFQQNVLNEIATDKSGIYAGITTEEERQSYARTEGERRLNEYIASMEADFQKAGSQQGADTSVLERKQDVPEPIRELLGEYTDPRISFALTVSRISQLAYQRKFLTQVRELGLGSIFYEDGDPNTPPTHFVKIASDGNDAFSPLNGLYTTPEFKDTFLDISPTVSNDLVKLWMQATGMVKVGKTVLSPITQSVNVFANLGFLLNNGLILDLKQYGKSWQALADEFLGNKLDNPYVQELIEENILNQNITFNEIENDFGVNMEKELIKDLRQRSAIKSVKDVLSIPFKMYRAGDNMWKAYAYYSEADRYAKSIYGKKYAALTGDAKTEVRKIASEVVKNTMPNYERRYRAADVVRKNTYNLAGNFLAFQAESIRTMINSAQIAMSDIKSPDRKSAGIKRLAGIMAYNTAYGVITSYLGYATKMGLQGLLGFFDDEEQDENNKKFNMIVPEWAKSTEKYVKMEKDGSMTYYTYGSSNPYGIWYKSANAYQNGSSDSQGGLTAVFDEALTPFLGTEMSAKWALNNFVKESDDYGRPLLTTEDKWRYSFDKLSPTFFKVIKDNTDNNPNNNFDKYNLIGIKKYNFSPTEQLTYKYSDYQKRLIPLASKIFSVKQKVLSNKISKQEGDKLLSEYYDKEKEIVSEFKKTYEAFLYFGADPTATIKKASKAFEFKYNPMKDWLYFIMTPDDILEKQGYKNPYESGNIK
ncbi:hypothetical protein [uncultured Chryseobacterium sp.]|uniref:MuF-C-terminal domain-containing protein n=1 Tax=uncultured Chryseobacterium sp. TaxID=259322 RepID=UPI0025D1775B|nr:hypothetical protein [uncultured Chryseobacterium sp.]